MTEPVFWKHDPRHQAKKIKCAVCTACEWHVGISVCIYGGPFLGYVERKELDDTALLADAAKNYFVAPIRVKK